MSHAIGEVLDGGRLQAEPEVVSDPRAVLDLVTSTVLEKASELVAWLPLLVAAVVLIALFTWLASWVGRWSWPYRKVSDNPFVRELLRNVVRLAIFLVGVLLALELLDATALVGAVLGAAGILGIALGFAFRSVGENFLASVLLSIRQPFGPSDHVVIGEHEGKVLRLTTRSTWLVTLDGNHLRIPNATVFTAPILNYTRSPLRRFDFLVGVGVEDELQRAERIGVEALAALPGVVAEPKPYSYVVGLGDSTVSVRFYAWVDQQTHDRSRVMSDGIIAVKAALEGAGVEMPEPAFRVRHMKAEEEAVAEPSVEQPAERPSSRPPATASEHEIPADVTIDQQIERERAEGADDLLSGPAKLE